MAGKDSDEWAKFLPLWVIHRFTVNKQTERALPVVKAMTTAHANCLEAERSIESAPEPLIMTARQMTMARMWYS